MTTPVFYCPSHGAHDGIYCPGCGHRHRSKGEAQVTKAIEAPKRCDHKFVDSKVCLKCGWRPFCGRLKYSHDDSCCPKDPNRKIEDGKP